MTGRNKSQLIFFGFCLAALAWLSSCATGGQSGSQANGPADRQPAGSKTKFEKISSGLATYKLKTDGCGELVIEVSTDSSYAGRRADLRGRKCDFSNENHRRALATLLKFTAEDTKDRPPFAKLNVEKRAGDPTAVKLAKSMQKAFVENGFCILTAPSDKTNYLYDVKIKGDCD